MDAADEILSHIRRTAAVQLGRSASDVASDEAFTSLGADSLSLVNLARNLERTYAVRVSMRELFEDGDTPRKLAQIVAKRSVKLEERGSPTRARAQVASVSRARVVAEPRAHVAAETRAFAVPDTESRTPVRSERRVRGTAEPRAQVTPESRVYAEPEPDTEPRTLTRSERRARGAAEPRAHVTPEPRVHAEPEPEPEPRTQAPSERRARASAEPVEQVESRPRVPSQRSGESRRARTGRHAADDFTADTSSDLWDLTQPLPVPARQAMSATAHFMDRSDEAGDELEPRSEYQTGPADYYPVPQSEAGTAVNAAARAVESLAAQLQHLATMQSQLTQQMSALMAQQQQAYFHMMQSNQSERNRRT
ncbi:MAG: phosphopantetheine-binding protein [Stackebrandtia sp.]